MHRNRLALLISLSIALIAVECRYAVAQARVTPGIKTDYKVYPEPEPPRLPPAGETFIDPTFGTRIMRVTDERDGAFNVTNYSYYPSFNRDNSRLFIISGSQPALYDFDPAGFRISGKRLLFRVRLPEGGHPWSEDAIWSGVDRDVIYCHAGLKLYSYNVATDSFTLVKDFTGQVAGSELMQMSKSIDDQAFAFHSRASGGQVVGYVAWRRNDNLLYRVDTSNVNEVQVDKTGEYLVVTTEQAGRASDIEVKVVHLVSGRVKELTDGAPDYAPGHKDVGRAIVVGGENWGNSLNARSLAEPHRHRKVLEWGNDWTIGGHVSMLADDEQWVLVSSYHIKNGLASSGLFRNELYQVAVDGSKRVRRLAHLHSQLREYWDSPRATISRDGRWAAFTSNWGRADRKDVFIVKIPPPGNEPSKPAPINLTAPGGAATVEATKPGTASGQEVIWVSAVNCAMKSGALEKSAGRDGAWDAAARSAQSITSGDGFIEFTAMDAGKVLFLGLARNPAGVDLTTIDFAIKLTASGAAEIRELNLYAGETRYAPGDLFRIAIERGAIKYYKNGALIHTSLQAATYPLAVSAVLGSSGARLSASISTASGVR
jgi:hypothetical protein